MARSIFPFDPFIRSRPAYAALKWSESVPPDFVIREIDEALKRDPNSMDLIHDRKVMEGRQK